MPQPGKERAGNPAATDGPGLSVEACDHVRELRAAEQIIRDTTRLTRLLTILNERGPLAHWIDRALATLSELFSADIVTLLDPAGTGSFMPLASTGLPEEMLSRPFTTAPYGYVGEVMHTGEPVLCLDAEADPKTCEHLRELGIKAAVWLPVSSGRMVQGVLILARLRAEPFTAQEVDLLRAMAYRLGLTLDQARLTDQLQEIVRAGREINRHLDEPSVRAEAVRLFPGIVHADAAALVLPDAVGTLRCVALHGLDPALSAPLECHAARLLVEPATASGLSFTDLEGGDHGSGPPWPRDWPVRALLAVPIQCGHGNQGFLYALRLPLAGFGPGTRQAALLYAGQVSAALDNARLYRTACSELKDRMRAERDLFRMKEEAERANEAKSEFLARVSHEIRTPMNAILGLTELLLGEDVADNVRSDLWLVKQAGLSMLHVVNDVLDISRIEAGHMALELRPLDPRALVEACLAPLRVLADAKGLSLTIAVAPEVPRAVMGDQGRLRQILTNLVGNAIKFTEKGGVHIVVTRDTEEACQHGLAFRIADTGRGIPERYLESIFEPFTQVGGPAPELTGGTGLGLYICKCLVDLMHGRIGVESMVGRGSTFYFSLAAEPVDVSDAPPPARPRAGAGAERVGPGLRVLLADDDATSRYLTQRLLQKKGHSVCAAVNGREALEMLAAESFDLVLLDMDMPELDGLSATRAIRRGDAGAARRAVPVVALTAFALAGDREKCLEAGVDDYLSKPLDFEELDRVLGSLRPH